MCYRQWGSVPQAALKSPSVSTLSDSDCLWHSEMFSSAGDTMDSAIPVRSVLQSEDGNGRNELCFSRMLSMSGSTHCAPMQEWLETALDVQIKSRNTTFNMKNEITISNS